MYIIVEAGHGGGDVGASIPGLTERELTLRITKAIRGRLRHDARKTFILGDYNNLQTKINVVNDISRIHGLDHDNSILISIHVNAGGGTGVETFSYKDFEEGLNLGNSLLLGINKKTGLKIRGAKYENQSQYKTLGIVHDTKPLACLVECGFIDTDWSEKSELEIEEMVNNFADGIIYGMDRYLKKKTEQETLIGELSELINKYK